MRYQFLLFLSGTDGLVFLKAMLDKTRDLCCVFPAGFDNKLAQSICNHLFIKAMVLKKGEEIPPEIEFDFLISSGFQFLIPEVVYQRASVLSLNIHASDLPKYCGLHSDVWALINGEEKLAVTVHALDNQFDRGPIIKKYFVGINDRMRNSDIYESIFSLYPVIASDLMSLQPLSHSDVCSNAVNYWRKRTHADSRINWRLQAKDIFYFVRALDRNPIYAFSSYFSKVFRFSHVVPVNCFADTKDPVLPGTVLKLDSKLIVACGGGTSIEVKAFAPGSEFPANGIVMH